LPKNEDMVERMAEVGLKGYFIGFESGSDRVLKFLRKGTTREKNLAGRPDLQEVRDQDLGQLYAGAAHRDERGGHGDRLHAQGDRPRLVQPGLLHAPSGSDLYDYCVEHDLSLITSHDQYRRNPWDIKVKGQDPEFLQWALKESQRRKPANAARRQARYLWGRYARPDKVARRARAGGWLPAPNVSPRCPRPAF
jgi:hypothetical protein